MLSGPSTIVAAYPDREKSHAEFEKGVRAICRVISDERLRTVKDWAAKLEGEWVEALIKGNEEVRYSDFIDLMYTEATEIVENGKGVYREGGDVELVGEIFGFAPKDGGDVEADTVADADKGDGGEAVDAMEEAAVNTEG